MTISPFIASIATILGFAVLGLPIGHAMIGGSIMYLLMAGQDLAIAAEQLLQGLYNSYVLLAIPLFIFAADLMNSGGLSDRLLGFCRILVGRFRGGLGHVNVVASLIFSGMSGSAIADAVGMGRIVIKMMTRDGKYTPGYAAAITAASATIGPIVPPSIPLVLYALVSDASIGYLFLGGAVPGLIMGIVLMSMNSIMARLRKFPVEESLPTKEAVNTTFRALPALFMPVVLLVGIYGGVMTPTEAAAVAAAYAFFISVVFYRSISFKEAYMAVSSSAQSTVSVGILISGALVFNYVVTIENIPLTLSQIFSQFNFNAVEFLIAVNIVLLILGCLLEAGTILLVIIPMFLPTAQVLGIDLVHFGVVVVVNVMIGLITPPYGLLLFIVANITGLPLKTVIREIFPFLIVLICALLIITLVPDIVLWLPRQFGYKL
jgi:tripartite ATP-independent transporter DctM subunit